MAIRMKGGWVLQQRSGDDGKVVERHIGDLEGILATIENIVGLSEPGDWKFRMHWSPNETWEVEPEASGATFYEDGEEVPAEGEDDTVP